MISKEAKRVVIGELGILSDKLHRQAELLQERYGLLGELPQIQREAADYIWNLRKELKESK